MEYIGKCFLDDRGKRKNIVHIIDKWTTTNATGKVVQVRYIGQHVFCGQKVTAEYARATLDRWKLNKKEIKE